MNKVKHYIFWTLISHFIKDKKASIIDEGILYEVTFKEWMGARYLTGFHQSEAIPADRTTVITFKILNILKNKHP